MTKLRRKVQPWKAAAAACTNAAPPDASQELLSAAQLSPGATPLSSNAPAEEANICEWNSKAKRCELSHLKCLPLPQLPEDAACGEKLLAFVHIPHAAGSGIAHVLNSGCAAGRLYYEGTQPGSSDAPTAAARGGAAWHVTAKEYIAHWAEVRRQLAAYSRSPAASG